MVARCQDCELVISGALFPVMALATVHGSALGHIVTVNGKETTDGLQLGRAQQPPG